MNSRQSSMEHLYRTMDWQQQRLENQRLLSQIQDNNPNASLKQLVLEAQQQNKILAQQVEDAKRESEEAKKDARNAKVFSWISFAISTLIATASLVVAIVK